MGKIIESPSKKWPGRIILSDPITLPQALVWEKCIRNTRNLEGEITITDINNAMLPGILACVETWELEGLDPNKFPASPRKQSTELITWLTNEISRIYMGEEEKADPNE